MVMKTKTKAEAPDKARPGASIQKQPETPEKHSGPVRDTQVAAAPLPPPNGKPSAGRAADVMTASNDAPGVIQRSRMMTAMQRSVGNARLSRVTGMAVQTKLVVGAPNDVYEQEADRVADRVMRMTEPPDAEDEQTGAGQGETAELQTEKQEKVSPKKLRVQRQVVEGEAPEIGQVTSVQRQREDKAPETLLPRVPRRSDEVEKPTSAVLPMAQRKITDDEELASPVSTIQRQIEEEPKVAQAFSSQEPEVPPDIKGYIETDEGGGEPLSESAREFAEPRFGQDFGGVRVHTDSRAADATQALNARAFTRGQDIYFDEGQYRPSAPQGQRLLAHELTHTLQQGFVNRHLSSAVQRQDNEENGPSEGEVLPEGTPFRWIGRETNASLVIRKSWLLQGGVPESTTSVTMSEYPSILTPILEALIDHISWAAAKRNEILQNPRTQEITLFLRESHWEQDIIRVPMFRSMLTVLGLPPGAPVRIFHDGEDLDIYVDLAQLYPRNVTQVQIQALKPAVAERILEAIEQTVNLPYKVNGRVLLKEYVLSRLPDSARPVNLRLVSADAQRVFGERAWQEYQQRRPTHEAETGPLVRMPGGGYQLPEGFTQEEISQIAEILREITRDVSPAEGARDVIIRLSRLEGRVLLTLASDPNREGLLALLRRARGSRRQSRRPMTITELVETLRERQEMERLAHTLGYAAPIDSGEDDQPPIASRPVHGRIINHSGQLVPRSMEGQFEFEVTDHVDALRVPHVNIQWYAIPKPDETTPNPRPIETELTHYIDVRADSIINDRIFEVGEFPTSGFYEIHAFVHHNFYYPAHFAIDVEVREVSTLLRDYERELGLPGFQDMEEEAEAGATQGTLSEALFQRRGGNFAKSRNHIERQILELERIVEAYRDQVGNEDLVAWAEDRLEQLRTSQSHLTTWGEQRDVNPVHAQAFYATRREGVRGGKLNITVWFNYEWDSDEGGYVYSAHLFDHSELIDAEHRHYQASDSSYRDVMRELFEELRSGYPDGRISFFYQIFDGRTPTRQFERYEAEANSTWEDVREVLFSEPVSVAVNVVSAILTVFPPTTGIGIAIGLAYNAAETSLDIYDATRSDTLRARHAVDVALVAADILPLVGRASRVIRSGSRTLRAIEAGQFAGNMYVLTEEAFYQIENIRNVQITELAHIERQLQELEWVNPSSPRYRELRQQREAMVRSIRAVGAEVFGRLAASQAIQLVPQHAVSRIAQHVRRRQSDLDVEGMSRTDADFRRDTTSHTDSDPELAQLLPPDLRSTVPIQRNGSLRGNEVRVYYDVDNFGLVTNVHIQTSPNAEPAMINAHISVVRMVQRYSGLMGAARLIYHRIRRVVRLYGEPPPGTVAFNAMREVEKLPDIIRHRYRMLDEMQDNPELAADLRAEIAHLQAELQRHAETVDRYEQEQRTEEGGEFIAATAPGGSSHEDAVAASYPSIIDLSIDGHRVSETHYYYRLPEGGFDLRKYTTASADAPRFRIVMEDGQLRVRIVEETRRTHQDRMADIAQQYSSPVEDFPALERALTARGFESTGSGYARSWAVLLEVLHGHDPSVLDRALDRLGPNPSEAQTGDFRRMLREAAVTLIAAEETQAARVRRLREVLALVPDQRSKGELLSAFRRRMQGERPFTTWTGLSESPRLPDDTGGGRHFADGTVQVQGPQPDPDAPPSGRYLMEDKVGTSFDADQASYYSESFDENNQVINYEGAAFDGIIYLFENRETAISAVRTIRSLHHDIHVSYLNENGVTVWLR
jgi:hypothetical protein